MVSTMVTIQVNGQAVAVPSGQLLATCLQQLGYDLRLVALEFNGEILHRHHWPHTTMEEGDILEVVTIVGGGALPDPFFHLTRVAPALFRNGWR